MKYTQADKDGLKDTINTMVDSILKKYTDEDWIRLFEGEVNNFTEEFFSYYFKLTEGLSCCSDKARFVMHAIRKTFDERRYLPLQQTYRQYQEAGGSLGGLEGNLDKIAYWCPKNLPTTKEALQLYSRFTSRLKGFIQDFIDEENKAKEIWEGLPE